MGIVNLYRGLDSEKEILNFNGRLKDNLDLDWDHTHILKNGQELDSDYILNESDIIIIQNYPGALTTGFLVAAIVLGVVGLGVGIGVGIYANEQAKKAQKEMEEALKRIGKNNKNDVSSIPQLADAKNEKMDGKNAPIILGRHLFAPYFLSEPYIRPEGVDGEDLYWYGTFLAGQSGLCFEKVRNGTVDLVTEKQIIPANTRIRDFVGRWIKAVSATYNLILDRGGKFGNTILLANTNITLRKDVIAGTNNYIIIIPGFGQLTANTVYNWNGTIGQILEINGLVSDIPQRGRFNFLNPGGDDPPFYTPENFIEIVQKGNEADLNEFDEKIFEQKWVDSLGSTVELGRKKKDGAKTVNENGESDDNGIYMEDDGEEPVIRETARFPMRAEIEIFFPEGLYSWDSKNEVATPASVELAVEWSKDQANWNLLPINGFQDITIEKTITAGTIIRDIVKEYLSADGAYNLNMEHGGMYGSTPIDPNTIMKLTRSTSSYSTPSGSYAVTVYSMEIPGILNLSDSSGTKKLPASLYIYRLSEGSGMLTRSRTVQMRFLVEIEFPPEIYTRSGDPIFIRATRKTRIHAGSYRSRMYLSAIRTRQYNPNTSNKTQLIPAKNINDQVADKFCRMGVKLKVNKNTQEFMDRFNVISSMTGKVALGDWVEGRWMWNGGWSPVKVKTSNSAAVLLELITGLIHDPSRHEVQELDLNTFGKLYAYCMNREVEIKEDSGKVRTEGFTLECNGVLTSGTRKIDAITSILATCDGGIYIDEYGKLEVHYEDTQITPIALLNPQRIIGDSMVNQKSLERKTDGYMVEFVDQDSDFAQITHRILRPNAAEMTGLTTYSPMKLDFTTSYNQAMWHARRLLAKEEYRPGELKCTVGKEGRYYKPGSLIKVQHERFKIGLGSGEITQLIVNDNKEITGLKLMEKFDISDVRDYWVEYFVVDGDQKPRVVRRQIESVGQFTDTLTFTIPIDMVKYPEDVPVFGNILSAMYAEGLDTGKVWEAKRYIVADLSEIEDGYELALVEYDDRIYQTGEIGERKSTILNAPPMVFADQHRNEMQAIITTIMEQTSPQKIDQIARGVVGSEIESGVAGVTPRFRGVYYVSGLEDGTINGDQMNLNDWVFFAKGGTGDWAGAGEDYVWQWTATGWEIRPRPSQNPTYGWLYLAAVSSAAADFPLGVFSDVLCVALTSETALIENLYANKVIIRSDKKDGYIQSADYVPGVSGFIIRWNGDCEFNIGKFRGRIEAESGYFKGELQAATGTFAGNLQAAGGTFKGTLKANSIIIEGAHEASATQALNTGIVAFDNRRIEKGDFVSIGGYGYYTKRIKIVGKGFVRFRVNFRGSCNLYKEYLDRDPGQAPTFVSFTSRDTPGDVWSNIMELTEDVTFIQLYGGDWDQGGGTVHNFINTIFECRTSSEPGIFKFMSSPF